MAMVGFEVEKETEKKAAALEEISEERQRLEAIFQHLKSNRIIFNERSILVLLDVSDLLVYYETGQYADFLIEQLKILSQEPNVYFFLFAKISPREISRADMHATSKCTNLLLHLQKHGIVIDRIVMPGDLSNGYPKEAMALLEKQIKETESEIFENWTKLLNLDAIKTILNSESDSLRANLDGADIYRDKIEELIKQFEAFRTQELSYADKKSLLAEIVNNMQFIYVQARDREIKELAGRGIIGEAHSLLGKGYNFAQCLERKSSHPDSGTSFYMAGSMFIEGYIPAYEAFERGDQKTLEEKYLQWDALATLDSDLTQSFLPLNEKKPDASDPHDVLRRIFNPGHFSSKSNLAASLVLDPRGSIPGTIVFFDDSKGNVDSVENFFKIFNQPRLEEKLYPVRYEGIHLARPDNPQLNTLDQKIQTIEEVNIKEEENAKEREKERSHFDFFSVGDERRDGSSEDATASQKFEKEGAEQQSQSSGPSMRQG